MKTRFQLAEWALWVLNSNWLYAMGTYGQRLQTIYPTLARSWYYTSKNPEGFKRLTAIYNSGQNPRVYDCHGIVDGFRMDDNTTDEIEFNPSLDIAADSEFNRVKQSGQNGIDYGPIDGNMKDNAGYGYWRSGHFGVGVGNGEVVDIGATGYPARKLDQTLGDWSYWCKCFDIDYSNGEATTMIKYGDGPNQAVYDLQTAYQKLGYNIGAFKNMFDVTILDGRDGKYGNTCVGITNAFKAKYGLAQDGIVDADTYGKIAMELVAMAVVVEVPTGISQESYNAIVAERDAIVLERDAANAQIPGLVEQASKVPGMTEELAQVGASWRFFTSLSGKY